MTQIPLPLENPYWTACRRALGREPTAAEYFAWNREQWRAYAASLGLRVPASESPRIVAMLWVRDVDAAFAAWLTEAHP